MKRLIVLSLLIMIVGSLGACVAPTPPPAAAPTEAPAPVTIKMVYWPGPESDAMQKVVDWYNTNKSPESGVKVEMILFSREGFWEKQETIMAAGSPEVDMIFTASYIVGKHAPFLDPLDPYFADPSLSAGGSPETFIPSALDSLKVDGKMYGIPMDVSNHFLYYRTDLIDKLLTDPEWGGKYTEIAKAELGKELTPKKPEEWNWDDFMATALSFTKKYNPDAPTDFGTALQAKNLIYNVMIWNDVLYSLGGTWFKEGDQPAFDTPEAREAMDVFVTLMQKEASPAGSTTYEYAEANEAFKTGKVALILQWSAAYHELTDPEKSAVADQVGLAPIPGPRHATHVHALGVGLNAASEHKEEAFKWISFLATPEAMRMYAEAGGIPPVSEVLTEMGDQRPEFPIIAEHVDKYGFVETTRAETVPILEILAKRFSAAWALETSPEEALDMAQQEVIELLK